jgi:hypothetical protein
MLRDNCTHVASREKELLAAAVNVGGAVTAAKKQNKPGTVVPLLCNDVRRCGCALAVLWCLATHVPCRYVHCFALLLPALFPTLASTEHLTFTNSSNSRCLAARVRVARLYPRAWAFVAQVGDWSESSHPRQAELFFFSFLSFELSLKVAVQNYNHPVSSNLPDSNSNFTKQCRLSVAVSAVYMPLTPDNRTGGHHCTQIKTPRPAVILHKIK